MKLFLCQVDTCDGPEYPGIYTKKEDAIRAGVIRLAQNHETTYQSFAIELEVDPPLPSIVIETRFSATSTHWQEPYVSTRQVEYNGGPRSGFVDLSIGESQPCFRVWSLESREHVMELYEQYIKENKPNVSTS